MSELWRPDVRAGEAGHVALGFGGVRISGQGAGYPGPQEVPDVRACGAGCPGPGRCSWLFPLVLLIRGLGDLSVFMRIFGRTLLVPNHAQHLGLR